MCKVADVGSVRVVFGSSDSVTSKKECFFIILGMKTFMGLSDMRGKVLFLN